MEELKQQTAEEQEKREEVTAALADLIAEAQTATTDQIRIVADYLKRMQELRGGQSNG